MDKLAILLNELKLAGLGVNLELAVCPGYFDNGPFTRRLVDWCEVLVIDGKLLDGTSAASLLAGRIVGSPCTMPLAQEEEEECTTLCAIGPDAFATAIEVEC